MTQAEQIRINSRRLGTSFQQAGEADELVLGWSSVGTEFLDGARLQPDSTSST
jgi:hypothetical protein